MSQLNESLDTLDGDTGYATTSFVCCGNRTRDGHKETCEGVLIKERFHIVKEEFHRTLLKMADECVKGYLDNIDAMELSDEVNDIIGDFEGRFPEKAGEKLIEWFKKQLEG